MNWEYSIPRSIYKSPSNLKELVWDHSAKSLERTDVPIVKCAIVINHRGAPCPKDKKLDEQMFTRIQNCVEEQEKDRVSIQEERYHEFKPQVNYLKDGQGSSEPTRPFLVPQRETQEALQMQVVGVEFRKVSEKTTSKSQPPTLEVLTKDERALAEFTKQKAVYYKWVNYIAAQEVLKEGKKM